jgi:glutathionylspermidine synthase
LADFPLLMGSSIWSQLAQWSTALYEQTLALEAAVLRDRRRWIPRLGLPKFLETWFRSPSAEPVTGPRAMRFDFFWTRDGWRISEVNSDVPGGYAEASLFTEMMAQASGAGRATGDPGAALVRAILSGYSKARLEAGAPVVLLAPTGFLEDWAVVCYVQRLLQAKGIAARLASSGASWVPGRRSKLRRRLEWQWSSGEMLDGMGRLRFNKSEPALVFRFYLAQWLNALTSTGEGWMVDGATPVMNPGSAVLSESKRLPLLWDDLGVPAPTWRTLAPECREPSSVDWQFDEDWLLKAALSDTGESITGKGLGLSPEQWLRRRSAVLRDPQKWVAQRRFEVLPVSTPRGELYPCIGVYVIEGEACGVYARLSQSPVTDYRAIDVALLLTQENP